MVFPLALQVRVNRRCCASQWYTTAGRSGSPDRESPPGKPVASGRLAGRRVAMSVSHHRASRWHRRDGSALAGWPGRKAVKRVPLALPVPSLGLLRRWLPLASRESAKGPRAAALQPGRGSIAHKKANRCGWPTSWKWLTVFRCAIPFSYPKQHPTSTRARPAKPVACALSPRCHCQESGKGQVGAARRPIPSRPNAAGLPGGCLRSSLPAGQSPRAPTPPACPADAYARRYPPASAPGAVSSRLLAHARRYRPANPPVPQCRRLARWMLTLVASRRPLLRELLAPGY